MAHAPTPPAAKPGRLAPVLLVAITAAATVLSGCGQPEAEPFDVEVHSGVEAEIHSDVNGTPPPVVMPTGEGRGHLAGVVVDEAIRPIEGAIVRLPSLALEEVTDRDGSFAFVDLVPSGYYVQIEAEGYRDADSMVEVRADEFTRAKVVLAIIPPPDPYHTILEFEGFADVSTNRLANGETLCSSCEFEFGVPRDGLRALILEAAFDAPDAGNERGFFVSFGRGGVWLCIVCSGQPDPMRLELRDEDIPEGSQFVQQADPQTFPGYEVSVHFHVYVTAFYHDLPPTGWSFIAGDT